MIADVLEIRSPKDRFYKGRPSISNAIIERDIYSGKTSFLIQHNNYATHDEYYA